MLDLMVRSDTVAVMITATRIRYWSVAAPLVVLVLMFCLSAAPAAVADDPGCGGVDSSARVCAQSGASTPLVAIVHELPPIQALTLPAMPLSSEAISPTPIQHHAELSTPRAPPSLA